MERQADPQRCTNPYQKQAQSHEMKAAFNGMLASSLVCLMLLGHHKAPVLLIASACSAVLGVAAELTLAQLYLKLLIAPGMTDGCIAKAAPYATATCTSLAVAWHYPDDEVLFLAKCFVLIWLVAYVFTFSAFAELMMGDG